jgi:hypothetical protein
METAENTAPFLVIDEQPLQVEPKATKRKRPASTAKKCPGPRLMRDVYKQVRKHPKFSTLSEGVQFGLGVAESGMSYATAANNKWARMIWAHLHLGTPMED